MTGLTSLNVELDVGRRLRLAGERRGKEAESDRADERSSVHYSMT
jgi:hypothetical protein